MSEISRRRPWLAVVLALLISGLGHAYLRRWGRALGWYVGITATLILLVPDAALDQLLARESPPLVDVLPALIVVAGSVIDAYVLAVRNNREYERRVRARSAAATERDGTPEGERGPDGGTPSVGDDDPSRPATGTDERTDSGEPAAVLDCPHCGRETDPELDFCHWCTEPLDVESGPVE
jgi:hypothetical protein